MQVELTVASASNAVYYKLTEILFKMQMKLY